MRANYPMRPQRHVHTRRTYGEAEKSPRRSVNAGLTPRLAAPRWREMRAQINGTKGKNGILIGASRVANGAVDRRVKKRTRTRLCRGSFVTGRFYGLMKVSIGNGTPRRTERLKSISPDNPRLTARTFLDRQPGGEAG
jgi:hypothetical protein